MSVEEDAIWIAHGGAVEPEGARTREGAIQIAREHAAASGFSYERIWVHDPGDHRKDEVIDLDGRKKLKHPGVIHVQCILIREI